LLHSVGVTLNALAIKEPLAKDISDESVVVAALFHDMGKVGYPGNPYCLLKDNRWNPGDTILNFRDTCFSFETPLCQVSAYGVLLCKSFFFL